MEVSHTVLLIGLSNSGKTTMLRSLCNRSEEIFPTAGFDITYVNVGVRSVLVYDCSGEGYSR
jgi:GTPase SAR1 family protein